VRDLLCELGHQFSTAMRTCYYWRSGATCRLLPCRRRPRSLLTARTPSRKNIPLSLFRRTARVYIALDRDATDRAVVLARTFGTRGRVLIPPEDLGPKGDLNDWLRVRAQGDPTAFRSILERALAMSPTPWALQIQRLPSDLAPWDLEDHPGARDLLCELGHQGPLSRDAHLRLLAERYGVALTTLQEAARELAQGADTDP